MEIYNGALFGVQIHFVAQLLRSLSDPNYRRCSTKTNKKTAKNENKGKERKKERKEHTQTHKVAQRNIKLESQRENDAFKQMLSQPGKRSTSRKCY